MPHLTDHLADSLASLPGSRTFSLHVLVSTPRKHNNLFPYADEQDRPKSYIQDILILLSEVATIDSSKEQLQDNPSSDNARFVSAIEANLFTIPTTSCSLLYISKVDSTGQGQIPSPTQTLVKSFLAYFADPTHRATNTLWVHLFARSQNQYLFPNSVQHPSKRVLSDSQLSLWWKHLLANVAKAQSSSNSLIECYYLLPGFSELEASQLLRQNTPLSTGTETSSITWVYGNPYSQGGRTNFPFGTLHSPSIADVIPSFPDDPKSRFLDELLAPTQAFDRASPPPRKRVKTAHGEEEASTDSVKKRVHPSSVASIGEFWEMMGFRQECVSGAVTGFFVLVFTSEGAKPFSHPRPESGQVSHNLIDRTIKSMLTVHEFSTDQRSFKSTEILETAVRNLCEGLKDASTEATDTVSNLMDDTQNLVLYQKYIHRTIKNTNPPLETKSVSVPATDSAATSETVKPITMLAVKKKKRKN